MLHGMTPSQKPHDASRTARRGSDMHEDGCNLHAMTCYERMEVEVAHILIDLLKKRGEAGLKGSARTEFKRHPSSPRFSTSAFVGMPAIAHAAPAAQKAPWSTSPQGAAEWCREHPVEMEIEDDDWSSDWHVPHLGIRFEDTGFLDECACEATEVLDFD